MAETAEEAVRQCETRGNEFSLGWHSVRHLPVLSCFLSCFLRGEIVRLAPRARIHVGVDAKTGRLRGRIPCFQRVWRSLHRIQVRMRPAGRPVKRKRVAHHSQPSSSTNTSHVRGAISAQGKQLCHQSRTANLRELETVEPYQHCTDRMK